MKNQYRANWSQAGALRVAALVDLERRPEAGGHVKVWERIAEAAVRAQPDLDLTVHFEGDRNACEALAPNVRIMTHRPVLSTRRLPMLGVIADHTDLAPFHPRLWNAIRGVDVVHTTDAYFAFARTARRAARRHGAALTTSVHTDTPGYTAVYAERILRRAFGYGPLGRLLVDRVRLAERCAEMMRARLLHHARACDWVMVGSDRHLNGVRSTLGGRISRLRRGIDTTVFSPHLRNRAHLVETYGVAPDRVVLLFVGRVDVGNQAMTFAAAVRDLIDRGFSVHAVVAGAGSQSGAVKAHLGRHVTMAGVLPQGELAVLYASADILVFPSRNEVAPNVVLEAKASGLPVVVASEGGGIFVSKPGVDGIVVPEPQPAAWASAIATLIADPARRQALVSAGLDDIAQRHPSWERVLAEDLLPVWQAARSRAIEAQRACSPLAFSS
jgi:glycosyltransferase involved in cell wall biosynthesis